MYRHIAVPVDGSPLDDIAVSWALLCASADSRIELIRVIVPPEFFPQGVSVAATAQLSALRSARAESEESFRKQVAELSHDHGRLLRARVLEGTVQGALEHYIEESGSDLVVMAAHDKGRVDRLIMGSVSTSVMRHVHCPVLLVREKSGQDQRPVQILRILVPLDGSSFAEQILPHVVPLAQRMAAQVLLLTVIEPLLIPVEAGAQPHAYTAESADEILRPVVERLHAAGIAVETRVLANRAAAHAITDVAGQDDIDIVAMTTHGRGGLARLVAGSVAQSVAHSGMPAAMLVLRPKSS